MSRQLLVHASWQSCSPSNNCRILFTLVFLSPQCCYLQSLCKGWDLSNILIIKGINLTVTANIAIVWFFLNVQLQVFGLIMANK
jgi:hypothetical protein